MKFSFCWSRVFFCKKCGVANCLTFCYILLGGQVVTGNFLRQFHSVSFRSNKLNFVVMLKGDLRPNLL